MLARRGRAESQEILEGRYHTIVAFYNFVRLRGAALELRHLEDLFQTANDLLLRHQDIANGLIEPVFREIKERDLAEPEKWAEPSGRLASSAALAHRPRREPTAASAAANPTLHASPHPGRT